MRRPAPLVQYLLVVLATALLTSGIWIGAYFAFRSSDAVTTTVSCVSNGTSSKGTGNGTAGPNPQPIPPNDDPKCTDSCKYSFIESIPVGLNFSSRTFNSTYDTWLELMNRAESEVDIISYYWTLNPEDTGDGFKNDSTSDHGINIFQNIIKTAQRNITVRIVQNAANPGYAETAYLEKHGYAQVRTMNFTRLLGAGILHTKAWVVDKKHFYVGSANLDWRSLTQVKELGIGVFDCPCLANDIYKLFELNWEMGAPMKDIPAKFPDALATYYDQQNPMQVTLGGHQSAVYLSASPPQLRAAGRENDGDAILKTIINAQKFVHISVMDYVPATLYYKDNFYWPLIDEALRIHVRLMMSRWRYTNKDFYAHLHSLAAINNHLACRKYYDPATKHNQCIKGSVGSIEVRLFEVPLKGWEHIPYARVNHNKYMVTDNTAYIGTSNWSGDYFLATGGIGFVLQNADISESSEIVTQLNEEIFMRDWNSTYTRPISDFDLDGNPVRGN
uniref:PLD phosphodiesterase domain-containing protein n=1 Tax=Steinernema glaseri TaxID=37863 RepID=A0A1I7Z5A0_9BILA